MSEELQSLLDRIEKDGVDKANAKAADIIKRAETRAADLIKDAEAKAADHLARAEEEGKAYEVRSRKALDQAARDVILAVEREVATIFARIAAHEVTQALDADTLRNSIAALIDAYVQADASGTRMTISLNETLRQGVIDHLTTQFQAALNSGLTIEGTDTIKSGFKVRLSDKDVEHDFTGDAVADALGELLRRDLADIVKGAAV